MTPAARESIAKLLAKGHTVRFVAETGITRGWSMRDIWQVVGDEGWHVDGYGKVQPRPDSLESETDMPRQPSQPPRKPLADAKRVRVSQRQYAYVQALLHDGADDQTLSERMQIRPAGIRTHLRDVLRATGYPNRTALALAVERGQLVLDVTRRTAPVIDPEVDPL